MSRKSSPYDSFLRWRLHVHYAKEMHEDLMSKHDNTSELTFGTKPIERQTCFDTCRAELSIASTTDGEEKLTHAGQEQKCDRRFPESEFWLTVQS